MLLYCSLDPEELFGLIANDKKRSMKFLPHVDQPRPLGVHSNAVKPLSNSLCHNNPHSSWTTVNGDLLHILIIGASNFIGWAFARELRKLDVNIKTTPTEDDTHIFSDSLSWYRWERLIAEGHAPMFVNFSDYSETRKFLSGQTPSVIFYSLSLIIEKPSRVSLTVSKISSTFKSFLTLLQVIKDHHPSTLVVILSLDQKWNRWIKTFELTLSSYNRLYGINIAIVRISNVYGHFPSEKLGSFKKACAVDSLSTIIFKAITKQSNGCGFYDMSECPHNPQQYWTEDKTDYQNYLKKQTKDVVMTTYFTTQKNPQYKVEFMNNNFYFMENWFISIHKLGLHMVLFHDDLSNQFVQKFERNYPAIEFVKVDTFDSYTPNDRRYFLYYDYLLTNKDIRYALMTDLRDIKILNNPFKMMDIVGDYVYLGIDNPFHDTSVSSKVVGILDRCYAYYPKGILGLYGNMNPGVLGGKRGIILAALNRLTHFIQESSKLNCNTAAASYLFHTLYYESVLTGWPLQVGFMTNQPHPPGLCVLHKWDADSWS